MWNFLQPQVESDISERTGTWFLKSDIAKHVIRKEILYWEWEEDACPEICQKFLWFRRSACGLHPFSKMKKIFFSPFPLLLTPSKEDSRELEGYREIKFVRVVMYGGAGGQRYTHTQRHGGHSGSAPRCPLPHLSGPSSRHRFILYACLLWNDEAKANIKPIYECRCNGRLQTKRSTRLSHTGLVVELEDVKIKTRLTND